jgi:hypothetical protein
VSELRRICDELVNTVDTGAEVADHLLHTSQRLGRMAMTATATPADDGSARFALQSLAMVLDRAAHDCAQAARELDNARRCGREWAARTVGALAARGAGAAVSTEPGTAAGGGPSPDLRAAVADYGLALVAVADIDFSDNPIVGDFGRGGAAAQDYEWAARTWNDVVAPGLAAGKTRDDFAAQDAATGAPPLRRTQDVWDMFVTGSDVVAVERRPDGTWNPRNGRHRTTAAAWAGVNWLPARILS